MTILLFYRNFYADKIASLYWNSPLYMKFVLFS